MFSDWGQVRSYARYCAATFTSDNDLINDYAHDALLKLLTKDLNDIHKRYVFLSIRAVVSDYYRKYISYTKNYERVRIEFENVENSILKNTLSESYDIDLSIDVRTKINEIRLRSDKTQVHRTMVMLMDGHTRQEIKDETSNQSISYAKKKLRMEFIDSPFNGSRVKIPTKNRITRKTYDNNSKYKEEFEYNTSRGDCDQNDSFLQLIHKEKEEYLLVVENK